MNKSYLAFVIGFFSASQALAYETFRCDGVLEQTVSGKVVSMRRVTIDYAPITDVEGVIKVTFAKVKPMDGTFTIDSARGPVHIQFAGGNWNGTGTVPENYGGPTSQNTHLDLKVDYTNPRTGKITTQLLSGGQYCTQVQPR